MTSTGTDQEAGIVLSVSRIATNSSRIFLTSVTAAALAIDGMSLFMYEMDWSAEIVAWSTKLRSI
jgi:hypothetical protein